MFGGTPAATAGAAIGQKNEAGHRAVKITLPWQCPLTAGFAEHYAALTTCHLMTEPNSMVTDCGAVVSNLALSRRESTKHTNTMAGVMKCFDRSLLTAVVKTKAHRTAEQAAAQGPEEVVAHRLNDWVDFIAKRGALDGVMDEEAVNSVLKSIDLQVKRLRCLAAVVSGQVWPPVLGTDRIPWVAVGPSGKRHSHRFVYTEALQAWQCTACRVLARSAGRATVLLARTCAGEELPPEIHERGHTLRYLREANGGALLAYCSLCGHYGQKRFAGLVQRCSRNRSKQLGRLKWLAQGKRCIRYLSEADRVAKNIRAQALAAQ